MKVTTDACLFGAFVAAEIEKRKLGSENVLDIGTGTGLLSLMIAQKNDIVNIDAIEIDKDAGEQAKENVIASQWKDRINVIEADVSSFSFQKKYELIISNPPFYEKEIRSSSETKNIAHHSENLTLKELLELIKNQLEPGGNFFLLLPYKRNDEIRKLFKDQQLYISKIIFVRQSVKHDFFRIMLKGKTNRHPGAETGIEEISIWDEKQQYTNEFTHLLKDYYLHL